MVTDGIYYMTHTLLDCVVAAGTDGHWAAHYPVVI